jgi:hypothetical protein
MQLVALSLPAYMVPADLMLVEAFPVNSSHKTDRASARDRAVHGHRTR